MTTEHDVMPHDCQLLSRVLEDHGVTVSALANRSGYDDKSVYRYLAGERTIPSIVLRAAFELTHDMRILGLVTGGVPLQLQLINAPRSADPQRIPPIAQLVPQCCKCVEQTSAALKYLARIVEGGEVDASDQRAAVNFQRHAAEAQRLLALVSAAVNTHAERNRA